MRKGTRGFLLVAAVLTVAGSLGSAWADGASAADALVEGFARPPSAARPRVWWHWMNGNVSKAGKPSPTGRLTFTTWHHWKKDDKLIESGLIGPVRLEAVASSAGAR